MYTELLEQTLGQFNEDAGQEILSGAYGMFRNEATEASSRELIVQLLVTHFSFGDRIKFLIRHRDLVIPYLVRIKLRQSKKNHDN